MSEVAQEDFYFEAERARLHLILDKDYAHSVFGSSKIKSAVYSHHSNLSSQSAEKQSTIAKKAEYIVQLAAKKAEIIWKRQSLLEDGTLRN